jgi:hypothetical protein
MARRIQYLRNSRPLGLFTHKCLGLTENDHLPVELTSVIMKRFERLVKDHITSTFPVTLDPH